MEATSSRAASALPGSKRKDSLRPTTARPREAAERRRPAMHPLMSARPASAQPVLMRLEPTEGRGPQVPQPVHPSTIPRVAWLQQSLKSPSRASGDGGDVLDPIYRKFCESLRRAQVIAEKSGQ